MVEERVKQEAPARFGPVAKSSPQSILTVDFLSAPRRVSGIQEFDRVMGGGIVPGSLTLIGGDPGIGK